MRTLQDKSFDLILTDIPYDGVNRESSGLRNLDKKDADVMNVKLDELLPELLRLCSGSFYIFCGFGQISQITQFFINNKINPRLIIWEKTNPSPMNGDVTWLSGIEPCVFGKLPNATFNAHCRNTVLKYATTGGQYGHPTEKPVELFKDLITVSSKENMKVLDPFLGSGTTLVAAKQLNRNAVGIEISPEYCEIARNRLKQDLLF